MADNRKLKLTMINHRPFHIVLAAGSCLALVACVLACTLGSVSFSPDDRQLLYPAFDLQNGSPSIALYDRITGRSEQIFSGVMAHVEKSDKDLVLMRAEWLPDGKHILILQFPDKEMPSLIVVPHGVNEPVRHILFSGTDGAGEFKNSGDKNLQPFFPLALAANQVLINGEHHLYRVDCLSGSVLVSTNEDNPFVLPAGDGKTIVGIRNLLGKDTNAPVVFGIVDPETLVFTPQLTISTNLCKDSWPHYDPKNGEIVCISEDSTNRPQQLFIYKNAVEKFSRRLTRDNVKQLVISPDLSLSSKKDRVFTAYMSQTKGQTNVEIGLVEIPLNENPLRFTPLFQMPADENTNQPSSNSKPEDGMFAYFPSALSHDGRTWAMSSSSVALMARSTKNMNSLRPEDCALYLVQVDGSPRKVTKVPIALPKEKIERDQ